MEDYQNALLNEQITLILAQKLDWKKGIAKAYSIMGVVYLQEGNYPEALKNDLAALKLYEESGNKQNIANTHNNLGNVFFISIIILKHLFIMKKL